MSGSTTSAWQIRQTQPILHGILLACVLSEIILLEVLAKINVPVAFYGVNAGIILAYAFCISRMMECSRVPHIIIGFGFAAIGLDLIGDGTLRIPMGFCWLLMHIAAAYILTNRVFLIQAVRIQEILDAITIFLVMGMVFVNLYFIALIFSPLGLTASSAPHQAIGFDSVVYYSFIMQLTVGDGDILARTNIIRAISVVQALFGVLYLSILVARFVSIYTASAAMQQQNSSNSGSTTNLED